MENTESKLKEVLVEDTATPNAPNVDTTDENLSVEVMFQQAAMPSLGRQIFSVLPIHGPTAALFNILKKATVPAVAQVATATPVAANTTVYELTINGSVYSFTSGAAATVAEITAGLAAAITASGIVATDNTTSLTLTAIIPGVAFTVTDTGAGNAGLVQTTANVKGVNDFKLVRNNVQVENSTSIPTGVTQEVVQDLLSQYGKEANNIIGKLLRSLANDDENATTMAFLNAQAVDAGALTLSSSLNAETNLFEISQKVHELVLKINSKNLRSFEAFAVIPYQAMGGIMGLSKYAGAEDNGARGLFIDKIGQTNFYLNPDALSTTAYVGIKDKTNPNKSSAVFSPYTSTIVNATDPTSGNPVYHIFNRYAVTASPLHEAGNEMLYKFTIIV